MESCKDCGEHVLDCSCSEPSWNSFDDIHPAHGQKCQIKYVQTLDAFYVPEDRFPWDIVNLKDEQVTAWRPLYG